MVGTMRSRPKKKKTEHESKNPSRCIYISHLIIKPFALDGNVTERRSPFWKKKVKTSKQNNSDIPLVPIKILKNLAIYRRTK